MNKKIKNNKTEEKANQNNILRVLKGSSISIILSCIIILLMSILLTFTNIPETLIPKAIIGITSISVLFGSIISTIHINKNGIINGGLVGLIYIIVIYLLSSLTVSGFALNLRTILLIGISIIAGMIGGIVGVNVNK